MLAVVWKFVGGGSEALTFACVSAEIFIDSKMNSSSVARILSLWPSACRSWTVMGMFDKSEWMALR